MAIIEPPKLKTFVESDVASLFGLSIPEIAEQCKTYGRFNAWLNQDINDIIEVLTIVEGNGVSPAFFASYERTEGYNSQWGWLNHTSINGNYFQDADSVSQWVKSQSNNTTDNPAWIDMGNPLDFVPQSVKDDGNAHFSSLPTGTIGRVVIAGTAAATWEVYYPNGLLAEYNGVQDYAPPLIAMVNIIEGWGGVIDGSSPPIDNETIKTGIKEMLTKDIYKKGSYYGNGFITIMKQLENSYKVQPNKPFFDRLDVLLSNGDGGGGTTNKVFPVKITNGINFWKRDNWGVGTLQKNMTYGVRSDNTWHYGYDIGGGGINHNIYSVTKGEVLLTNFENGIGNQVIIKNDNDTYYLKYGHLDSYNVQVGDKVNAGDLIGVMGDTGGSYDIHLDLKISTEANGFYNESTTIDPEGYLQVTDDNTTTLQQP